MGQCLESACLAVGCGNSILEAGEACDDGNTLGGDGCSARCDSDERCGNAFLDTAKSEGCDCGDASFTGTRPPGCNNQPNSDDPNSVCTATCQIRGCGDGVVGGLEDCDGSALTLTSCDQVGFYQGTLSCLPSCRYDVNGCSGRCGDGSINGPTNAELCDDSDLGGRDCTTFGYYNASGLACNDLCGLDTTACTGFCGDNSFQSGNEICDPGETESDLNTRGLDCTDFGFYSPAGLACSSACQIDTSGCGGGFCGDGTRQASEDCDETDLDAKTCSTFGYYQAAGLACRPNCTFDFGGCSQRCGDTTINGPEQCDGSVPAGTDCTDFGYYAAGGLVCNSACAFDTSGCMQKCGDNMINGLEQCDGTAPLSRDCTDFGFYQAGGLACASGCIFDTSGCMQRCGDSTINGPEECDGSVPAGSDCTDFGYYTAAGLQCNAACAFDTTGCSQRCGDATINGGEQCDGSVPGGTDCTDFGFYVAGGLTCSGGCTFNVAGCSQRCGDTMINGPEQCDGSVPAGFDCLDFGYYVASGLTCSGACAFDVAGCQQKCGDELVNGPEVCDSAPAAGNACVAAGYDAGQLGCSGGCSNTFEHCKNFDFEFIYPGVTAGILQDVWGSGNEFFAVGGTGTIVRNTGGVFSPMPSPTTGLDSIWGSSPTSIFAVGNNTMGQNGIFRYDGTGWNLMTSPTVPLTIFRDVFGTAANNVWAVGDGGAVFRYTGAVWNALTTPIGNVQLTGVWASGTFVHVVGSGGTLFRFNTATSAWTDFSGLTGGANFRAVFGTSTSDVYAITNTQVWRYNGTTWAQMSTSCPGVIQRDITATPSGTLFIVGEDSATTTMGRACQFGGGRWERITVPDSVRPLWAVYGTDTKIVAVGDVAAATSSGANFSETTIVLPGGILNPSLNTIWGTASNNLNAVGRCCGGLGYLAHWNGTSWTGTNAGSGSFGALYGGTGWAVGGGFGGALYASDGIGGGWTSQTSNTTNTINDVWGNNDGTSVYAVGRVGTIVHRVSGTWGMPLTTNTTNDLNAVWGVGTTIFAVGNGGVILQRIGTGAVTTMTSPTTQDLKDVFGRSATDVYAVGLGGAFHYNGTTWSPVPGDANTLMNVVFSSTGDMYAFAPGETSQIVGGRVLPALIPTPGFSVRSATGTPEMMMLLDQNKHIAIEMGRMFRPDATETSCENFWDDDENGRVDCADPQCNANAACLGNGACTPIVSTLACGSSTPGNTVGGSTKWPAYACTPNRDETGPERYYYVRRSTAGNIQVTVSGFSGDLDVIVSGRTAMGACQPDEQCLASSQTTATSEVATFAAAANTDYIVIVDGAAGASSAFTIDVLCP